MPDITMCDSKTCVVRKTCHRNPESGTNPSEYRQSWFVQPPGDDADCVSYWPTNGRK